jgi:RNA polymerase I-specific transcription initiation factor RRN5
MSFVGHTSDHVATDAFHQDDGRPRSSKQGKHKKRGLSKRKKSHRREGARANDDALVNHLDHHPAHNQAGEMSGPDDSRSQESHSFSSGQGKRIGEVRNRGTDSDGGAALNSRQGSPTGHQPPRNSADSGKGGITLDEDGSDEVMQRYTSDSEEILPAHHRAPPSHQPSPEKNDHSPDEDERSNLSESHSMRLPIATGDDPAQRARPRKRKSPEGARIDTDFRPLKKAKLSFNRAYLDILNEDIEHAVAQYVPLGRETKDERKSLPSSQIGTVTWTSVEKERFFEALGRLGRDDSPGIARRIGTKGDVEVRQYLKLLQDGLSRRRQQNELDPLELADFPAAVEISHECCEALDEVADSLAMRQDHFEQKNEERQHGAGWLVTQENCAGPPQGETVDEASLPGSVLNPQNWLKLSERLFMNGTSEESNWQSVDGDLPSLKHATLEDFYSVTLTLTRRLVLATLYTASSRIRCESGYNPEVLRAVRKKDVRAAALSLGFKTGKQPVLAGCARRLGLHVYEDPPKPGDEQDESAAMPYDAVEYALGVDVRRDISNIRPKIRRMDLSSDEEGASRAAPTHSETETDSDGSDGDYPPDGDEDEEDEDVKAEAEEMILYSAVDQPQTKRDRETLFRRIKAEREQEAYADAVDAQATYQEERQMWEKVLGRQPRHPLADPGLPPVGRRMKTSVGAAYSAGKNWRAHTKVMSEWEYRAQVHG